MENSLENEHLHVVVGEGVWRFLSDAWVALPEPAQQTRRCRNVCCATDSCLQVNIIGIIAAISLENEWNKLDNEWKLIGEISNSICWLMVDGWTTRWKTSTCTWWLVRVFGGSCQTLGFSFRSLRNKRGDVATFVARQILAFRSKFAGPSAQWLVRQEKTRQDKTRQDQTRQDKKRQDKTRQDKTWAEPVSI